MSNKRTATYPISNLLLLAGVAASIMIAGTEDAWAIVVFLFAGGLSLLFVRPMVRPAIVPLVLVSLFCCLCLLAFLPQNYFPVPAWRSALGNLGTVPLADSVNPQPWLAWFWWWLLAATCFVFVALLTTPLETKALALVLHGAALFVAVYASLSIFSVQTGWKYPLHGGAVFGFLPNRNHTATLLVTGSVLSFGLMQWRLARENKGTAAFAALCGAPSLAALLFFSMSRAGVVFLVAGLAVWAVGASRSAVMRTRILAAVAVLAVFLGLLFVAGGSTVRDRLAGLWSQTLSRSSEGGEDVDFRQPIFRDTTRMIADFPLTGAGLGQFRYVFPQYRKDSVRAADVLHPESDWLMVAAETGVPAALVLFSLFVWYVTACWRSRSQTGGMLRWTAASAVIAAALHGFIDVPWHRASVAWFLLVLAASGVPSSGRATRTPRLSRFFFFIGGIALIAAAFFVGRDRREGASPAPYRWPEVSAELDRLGRERRYEEAEAFAQKAVRTFPLKYETYYWLAGHLRAFEETGPEIDAAIRAARSVEPVLAKVSEEQAAILQPVDPEKALEAWSNAITRAAAIDSEEGKAELPSGGENVRKALVAFKDDEALQIALARQLMSQPVLLGHWLTQSGVDAAAKIAPQIPDISSFARSLPASQRRRVLSRWLQLPDSPRVVAFMEEQQSSSSGAGYWPVLAEFYAAHGDSPRAVRLVANSLGVALESPRAGEEGLRGEMAALQEQGNAVAARRVAADAVESPKSSPEDLAAAMACFASQEDWPAAWKAASRLAREAKIGQ